MKTALFVVASAALASAASAVTVPYTETFTTDAANWRDGPGTTTVGWSPAGGPDGSGHATTSYNFLAENAGNTPIVFRGQSNFGSSTPDLYGNWLAAGVTAVSVDVRHAASVPLTFFSRYSAAGPGAVVLSFAPVLPNTWTTLTFAINPANPGLILEGVPFATAFGNVQRVQFGVSVPASLAGVDQPVAFALDNVRVIPAPAGAAALGLGALLAARRRRA